MGPGNAGDIPASERSPAADVESLWGTVNNPKMVNNLNLVPLYLRSKGAWFVIDKAGVVRGAKIVPLGTQIATDEILQVLQSLK
jgi:alkyl hydroperoxide reductase subunit AhpC